MTAYGYSYVSDKAFVAFSHDIQEGAWKSISIAKYDTSDQLLAPTAFDAPLPVLWKLRIAWVLAVLKQALGSGKLDELDGAWDSVQRRVHHRLAENEESRDLEVRQAAQRLRARLLDGGTTAHTMFGYDEEVDFGRQQIELAKDAQTASDIKKLKLGEMLTEIGETTEALAKGAGRKAGMKKAGAPSAQQREALTACSAAFNGVHDDIAWFIEHTPTGVERDKLLALQAPFEALLARNPPKGAVVKAAPEAAAPAAPVVVVPEDKPE
jgi:hypothetical protein